jgi:HEAT repeat protein
MKGKFIVTVLIALGVAAAAGWFLVPRTDGPNQKTMSPPIATEPAVSPSEAKQSAPSNDTKAPSVAAAGRTVPPAAETNDQGSDASQNDEVAKRVAELQDLGMEDDSQSLNTILSELSNRDPRIRRAAVDASVQFGSRDAIPNLEDAAAQTDDPHDKAAILDAIEFLKLPTISEVLSQRNPGPPAAAGNH